MMPAQIIVQSGISAGAAHWIQRPVIRVGSDPNSDVCLPSAGVPAHALTLEFRDGIYRVYNRSQQEMTIGSRPLATGQAEQWQSGDVVVVHDIELVLQLEPDPSPAPTPGRTTPEYEYDEEPEPIPSESATDESSAKVSPDNSKFYVQLAITVMCLLGCVVLLARESLKGKTVSRAKPPSFTRVVRDAQTNQTSPELVQRLQYAESAAIAGNRKIAQDRFGGLRDDLVALKGKFEANGRQSELAILDFVEFRLGQLE